MFPAHASRRAVWPAQGIFERRQDTGIGGGHHFCATFSHDFRNAKGFSMWGSWHKNFSTEETARELAARELPVEKKLSSGSTRKLLPSAVWNWIPGPALATANSP